MSITFPTGNNGQGTRPGTHYGNPRHARPCQCEHPLIVEDTSQCLRCGKYPKATIQRTWQERAEQVAARARARKAAA